MNDTMGSAIPLGASVAPGVSQSGLLEVLTDHANELIGTRQPDGSVAPSAFRVVVLVAGTFVVGDDGLLPVAFGVSLTDGNKISRNCYRKLALRLRLIADGFEREAP